MIIKKVKHYWSKDYGYNPPKPIYKTYFVVEMGEDEYKKIAVMQAKEKSK